jgi:hypothetical protein
LEKQLLRFLWIEHVVQGIGNVTRHSRWQDAGTGKISLFGGDFDVDVAVDRKRKSFADQRIIKRRSGSVEAKEERAQLTFHGDIPK